MEGDIRMIRAIFRKIPKFFKMPSFNESLLRFGMNFLDSLRLAFDNEFPSEKALFDTVFKMMKEINSPGSKNGKANKAKKLSQHYPNSRETLAYNVCYYYTKSIKEAFMADQVLNCVFRTAAPFLVQKEHTFCKTREANR